jgi:7,8-dihydropterin-6-yl-methyl-4-(beta-D-ribofuranosyl)aminobenzene 5'-phosphate synthase
MDVVEISTNLFVLRTHTDIPTVGISDELSMLIKTAQGPYVLTGCSHTGVARIMEKAAALAGREIFHYTGGARLKFRGVRDTEKVADELNRLRVSQVSPGHCSIDHAVTKTMKQRFNGRVISSALGTKIPLHTPGIQSK